MMGNSNSKINNTNHKHNVSKNLFVSILFLSFLWISVFTWLYGSTILNEREALIEKEKEVITNMSQIISVQTSDYFKRINMFLITADLWLASHPEVDPRTDKAFLELVNAFRESSENKIDIRLVSEDGGLFYIPSENMTPLADVSDRLYFTAQSSEASKGFIISDPVKSRVTDLWGIPISYPLRSNNRGISVIFAAIEIRNLEAMYMPLRSNVNETIILVRNDGKTLAHTPFKDEVMGKDIVNWPWWEDQISKSNSGLIFGKSDNGKKITSIAAFQTLEDLPLVVIVVADMKSTLSTWNDAIATRLIIITTALFFVFITTFVMLHLIKKLNSALTEISKLSITDSLTGLFNRRKAQELLDDEIYRSVRYVTDFSVILLDIDFFKHINDELGHNVGDKVLISLAKLIIENVRKSDEVCRWGGEEFVIFCPNTTTEQATLLAEKLRVYISTALFADTCKLTCSFGVTSLILGESSEEFINRADENLYRAKAEGRNLVVNK